MKKYTTLLALVCVALLVVGSVAPAVANGKGAQKADLFDLAVPANDVGKVIVTPTADGKLEVTVQYRGPAPPPAGVVDYNIKVKVGVETEQKFTAALAVNKKNMGTGHVSVTTALTGPQTVLVDLWRFDVHYATATVLNVPLK